MNGIFFILNTENRDVSLYQQFNSAQLSRRMFIIYDTHTHHPPFHKDWIKLNIFLIFNINTYSYEHIYVPYMYKQSRSDKHYKYVDICRCYEMEEFIDIFNFEINKWINDEEVLSLMWWLEGYENIII